MRILSDYFAIICMAVVGFWLLFVAFWSVKRALLMRHRGMKRAVDEEFFDAATVHEATQDPAEIMDEQQARDAEVSVVVVNPTDTSATTAQTQEV